MQPKAFNVESMLRSAFLKAELEFLKSDPQFASELPLVKTPKQFERLCKLAEELLGAHGRVHPSAKQLRHSVGLDSESARA